MTVKTNKYKKLIIILCCILAFLIVCVSTFFILLKIGEKRLRDSLSHTDGDLTTDNAYGDEADAYHKGKAYYYNKDLINILVIGVDKEKINDKSDHQADALYLISVDTVSNKVNVLSVSRNTLADIDVYDMNGDFLDTEKSQICLSYVYGKDDKHSSELTCKAVSRLLYDIPINNYYTIFMDTIADAVNVVGGVKVTLSEDLTEVSKDWTKGKTVYLNGQNALRFLQYRKESNQPRVARQQQFIKGFVSSAKSAVLKDVSLPIKMYNRFSKTSVTNVGGASAVYLATESLKAEFKLHSVPGKAGFDGNYETFEVEEEALYEKVLEIFYRN